jgi:hypothetical protein
VSCHGAILAPMEMTAKAQSWGRSPGLLCSLFPTLRTHKGGTASRGVSARKARSRLPLRCDAAVVHMVSLVRARIS